MMLFRLGEFTKNFFAPSTGRDFTGPDQLAGIADIVKCVSTLDCRLARKLPCPVCYERKELYRLHIKYAICTIPQ